MAAGRGVVPFLLERETREKFYEPLAAIYPRECLPLVERHLASADWSGFGALVLAPGIQLDWDKIPGLPEALGTDGVCSNYAYEQAEKTWETLQRFQRLKRHTRSVSDRAPIK